MTEKQLGAAPSAAADISTKAYADLNLSPVTTQQDTMLTASLEHLANETLEVGSSYFLEVPATSTLEVATYAPPASGAQASFVATNESTASTSYADLTTVDTVTVTIGVSGLAQVNFIVEIYSSTQGWCIVGVDLSGANIVAASDTRRLQHQPAGAGNGWAVAQGIGFLMTGLAPGSTTFKLKYKVSSGTSNFLNRRLSVIPL